MPTPVGVARQCLTPDAARALDEAVSVARRRGHSQTTSLHAVSALLSLPSSTVRAACARARNAAYSSRLQFKALELCLSVSLDRVPSMQLDDEPPVSNSLMAAIKRSQANQRRQPENFHLYHQISQQPTSVSSVKVELQHLILSILDDPVVSRVFNEAGFRSSDIKLAILRPLPHLHRYRAPPIFLCNFTDHRDSSHGTFRFPFSDGEENNRRIGEVLSRNRGKNPLLLGICAYDALQSFTEAVNQRKDGALPPELSGLKVISIEKDVCDKEGMRWRLKEIEEMVEKSVGRGVVVNFGDLKWFVDENGALEEAVRHSVAELGKMVQENYGKVWLIGAASSYERYLKFVGRFPSVEKDWDLQLLPITSVRSPDESHHRPKSNLMDSFVPFGGFFSSPSDMKASLNSSYCCLPHCHQCAERSEQQLLPPSKQTFSASASHPHQSNLPPWLQIPELPTTKGLNTETRGDGGLMETSESGLYKTLDKTCQLLHNTKQFPEANPCPSVVSFQCPDNKKEDLDSHSSKITDSLPSEYIDLNSPQSTYPFPVVSQAKQGKKHASEASEMLQKVEDLESDNLRSSNMSSSSVCDGSQLSPTSVTSVTTDLGIGIYSSKFDLINRDIFKHPAPSSSCLSSEHCGQYDLRNPKVLFEALGKRVSWQREALHSIVETIIYCETKWGRQRGANQRGGIWMNFVGPDRVGKKKIAVSLAEILYGSQESFIFVDLNSEEIKGYDVRFRGKTILDFLAGELCRKPLSVVFLENADKADMLAQNSLSQAIKTGKITDLHGREVSVNNAVFVTSFSVVQDNCTPLREFSSYSEERILGTKRVPIRIKVEHVVKNTTEAIPNPIFINKRKLSDDSCFHGQEKPSEMPKRAHTASNWLLDLNLPAEENELQHTDIKNSEDVSTQMQNPWLQDLYKQVDETIIFKPYNFDALADRVLKVIRSSFQKILGTECSLQIESEVMEQLLGAAYLSEGDMEVENWVEEVLSEGFTEIQKTYNLPACSIVKLATCQDQASGVYPLPPRIIVD